MAASEIAQFRHMWETVDMLESRFGYERAKRIIALPSSLISEKGEGEHE